MQKLFIKNRKDQKLAVLLDETEDQTGLVFVMHGLGGFKEQPHLQTIGSAFKEKGFTVVYFDTTNTFGESDGTYEDATTTNYYEDLEDVIKWEAQQSWYQEPFVLAGHSLGGICITLFAEKYPKKVRSLAPISTVVSGKLSMKTEKHRNNAGEWKRTGWRISKSNTGKTKKPKWSHMEDRLKYDLLPEVSKLTMPVLMIVGENDDSTPLDHQQILFDALPKGKKELHVINAAPHTFRDQQHLHEIKQIFSRWIDTFQK